MLIQLSDDQAFETEGILAIKNMIDGVEIRYYNGVETHLLEVTVSEVLQKVAEAKGKRFGFFRGTRRPIVSAD